MKTVAEIRRSSAWCTFIAESFYLVLNSVLDWEPVEKLKQRCDVVSFTGFFFFFFFLSMTRLAQFCMRQRLGTEEAGRPERRELQWSRCDKMNEVTSFTVEWKELIRRS